MKPLSGYEEHKREGRPLQHGKPQCKEWIVIHGVKCQCFKPIGHGEFHKTDYRWLTQELLSK